MGILLEQAEFNAAITNVNGDQQLTMWLGCFVWTSQDYTCLF